MASFTGAKFFGEATLAYAIFFKVVSFDAAAFYRKTYFMLATFSGQMEASLEPNSLPKHTSIQLHSLKKQ
jgi:hypothetical protein